MTYLPSVPSGFDDILPRPSSGVVVAARGLTRADVHRGDLETLGWQRRAGGFR